MKRYLAQTLLGAFLLTSLLASVSLAQEAAISAPVIVVIDTQRVVQTSEAAKSLNVQLKALQEETVKTFSAREEALRASDQELARQKPLLSQEAFVEKRNELQAQISAFQAEVAENRKKADLAFRRAMSQIDGALIQISKDVATEMGANLVLPKSTVLLVDTGLDISEEVLKRLNEQLKTVELKVE